MSWSIVQVSRLAGVSSRTLRHYEARGLLAPAFTAANGYRHYEEPQLRRLQRILVLRELGVGLEAIGEVLGGADQTAMLRTHRQALLAERDRLDRLAALVARIVDEEEGGFPMSAEELFEGFDAERQKGYEAELVERFGPQVQESIDKSRRRVGQMSKADAARLQADLAERDAAYAALLDEGADPADPRVQEVTAGHYAWVCAFWTPDAESFAVLGDLYVDSPDFRERYEAVRPGLAEYVRDAMAVYAVECLA
jgi:DNA-binding transcriptional MerR regulator